MTMPAPSSPEPKSQLRKTMGFWDVLLFNIATVLGPRWIAAADNGIRRSACGPSQRFFFVQALVINGFLRDFPKRAGSTCGPRGVRSVSWIRCRMDLLDLHRLLFSRPAAPSMSAIIGGREPLAGPHLSTHGFNGLLLVRISE
jgi:hypothetical protein